MGAIVPGFNQIHPGSRKPPEIHLVGHFQALASLKERICSRTPQKVCCSVSPGSKQVWFKLCFILVSRVLSRREASLPTTPTLRSRQIHSHRANAGRVTQNHDPTLLFLYCTSTFNIERVGQLKSVYRHLSPRQK